MNIVFVSSFALLAMYILAGIQKIGAFRATVDGLLQKPLFNMLPTLFSMIAIMITIVIEIIAPLIILYALYVGSYSTYGYYSTLAIILFTVFATGLYHNPILDSNETIQFMKNTSIIGGLLLLMNTF